MPCSKFCSPVSEKLFQDNTVVIILEPFEEHRLIQPPILLDPSQNCGVPPQAGKKLP